MILPNLKIKAVAALALGGLPAIFAAPSGAAPGDEGGASFDGRSGVADVSNIHPGHGHGSPYPIGYGYIVGDPERLDEDDLEDEYCLDKVGEGSCLDFGGYTYSRYYFPACADTTEPYPLCRDFRISPEECANECGNRFGSRLRGVEWGSNELYDLDECHCIFDEDDADGSDIPEWWDGYPRNGTGPIFDTVGPDCNLCALPWGEYYCYEVEKCGTGGSSKSGKSGYYMDGKSGKGSSKSGKSGSKSSKKGGFDDCVFENPLAVQFFLLTLPDESQIPLTSSLVETDGRRRLARDREGRPGQIIKEYEESIATTAAPAAPTTVAPVDGSEEVALGSKDPDYWLYIFLYHQGYANYVFGELLKDWVNKGASPDDIFEAGEEIGMAHGGGHGHGHGHRRQLHDDDGCEEICGQLWLYVLQMVYTCDYDDFLADYVNVAANFMDGFAEGVHAHDLNVLKCPYPLDPHLDFLDAYGDLLTEETLAAIGSGGSGCDYHDHGHGHRLD